MAKSRKQSKGPQQPKLSDASKSQGPLASGMTDAERSALGERVETHQMRDDDIFTVRIEAFRAEAKVELAKAQVTHNLDGPYDLPEDREESARATAGFATRLLDKILVQGRSHSRKYGKGGVGRWHPGNDSDTQKRFRKRHDAKQKIEMECQASSKPIPSQHEMARKIAVVTGEMANTVRKWLRNGAKRGIIASDYPDD